QVITALAANASNSSALPDHLKALLHVNVADVVSRLSGDAQKRIAAAVPGEFGKALSSAIQDPQSLMKDPAKAIQNALPDSMKGKIEDVVKGRLQNAVPDSMKDKLNGLLPGQKSSGGSPTTQPDQGAAKSIEQGIGGFLEKRKKSDKNSEPGGN